ncbi:class I SAM-dependent methyltransferase [Arthrobacter zhaoguopingii]|uniref:class I SAM-dependent methyltransferase n=1 Tax=Arthrobacter zhaoguopingii TaxID=2681491 RepID=UPI00135A22F6|nr:class I SAM-dependent methyltransferase [Arthrobacter zhaoguopingii]
MPDGAKFDGLADDYDRYRPRYPSDLLDTALGMTRHNLRVVDAGAGTGISLEWVLPALVGPEVYAIDISRDMVEAGKRKFPGLNWMVGRIEDVLSTVTDVDLIIAGQAYQWFDRPAFLQAARKVLRAGGRVIVVQNNRDHSRSPFLSAYEGLLEERSPGYSRRYRDIDVAQELADGFDVGLDAVIRAESRWNQAMTVDSFVGMASSSTQAQRAVAAVGPVFLKEVHALVESYAVDGVVVFPYHTELFVIQPW